MTDEDLVQAMEEDLFVVSEACSDDMMFINQHNNCILSPKTFAKLKERYDKIVYEKQFMAELETCLTPDT